MSDEKLKKVNNGGHLTSDEAAAKKTTVHEASATYGVPKKPLTVEQSFQRTTSRFGEALRHLAE